jgi:hypothetical protein
VIEHDHLLTLIDATGAREQRDLTPPIFTPPLDTHAHPSLAATTVWAAEIVGAVRTRTQLAPNFVDGLRVQEVLAAARRSSDRGGVEVAVERAGYPKSE